MFGRTHPDVDVEMLAGSLVLVDGHCPRGFDAIIGNPPYIRIQTLKMGAAGGGVLQERLRAASKGNYDFYVVFVEKALSLLNPDGRLGFILPHKFFNAQYGEPLRALIAEGRHLADVVHFGDQQIFAGATTYTCLMFLDKEAGRRSTSRAWPIWPPGARREVAPRSRRLGVLSPPSLRTVPWPGSGISPWSGAGLFERSKRCR